MPISDKKKCQTLINKTAEAAEQLKVIAARLKMYRTLFQTMNPSVVGTPLEGYVLDVSNWINAVDAVAESVIADGMIAAYVPTHRGNALEAE